MANKYGYRVLRASWPFDDGSGDIGHDVEAVYSEDGGVTWITIPGRHINGMRLDHPGMRGVMKMPDGNAQQIAAKQRAYENLIINALRKQPGWSKQDLKDIVENNTEAADVSTEANEFITVTVGATFPIEFETV